MAINKLKASHLLNEKTGLAAAVALLGGLHLFTLMRIPPVFVDEGWILNIMAGFIQSGKPQGSLDYWSMLPNAWTANHWLYTALYSLILRGMDQPHLWVFRLQSLLTGFGLLYVGYQTALRLGGKTTAAGSTLLLSLSLPFFYSAHLLRYEIFEALLGYGGLYLVLDNSRQNRWKAAAAGLLLTVNLDVHLNAVIYILAAAGLLLYQDGLNFWRKPTFWPLALGGLLGLAFFAGVHFVPDLQAYLDLNQVVYGGYARPITEPGQLKAEIVDFFTFLWTGWNVLLPLIFIAGLTLAVRKDPVGRKLAVILAAFLAGVALLWIKRDLPYAILIGPAVAWVLVYWLQVVVKQRWVRIAVLAVLLGYCALSVKPALTSNYGAEFEQNIRLIQQYVKEDDTLMGNQLYWAGFWKHPYSSWEVLFFYPRVQTGSNPQEVLEMLQPDVILLDSSVWNHLYQEDQKGSPRLQSKDVVNTMQQILSQGRLVGQIPSSSHGVIEVYRFEWPEP